MRQSSRFLVLLLAFMFPSLIFSYADEYGLLGTWSPIENVKNPYVTGIAEFAIDEYNKQSNTNLRLQEVVNGEILVHGPDGTSYRIVLKADESGGRAYQTGGKAGRAYETDGSAGRAYQTDGSAGRAYQTDGKAGRAYQTDGSAGRAYQTDGKAGRAYQTDGIAARAYEAVVFTNPVKNFRNLTSFGAIYY